MSTPRYLARDLAKMSDEALVALPGGPMDVVFDDDAQGHPVILETTSRATIFSALLWEIYTRYPKTPAKPSHHIQKANLTPTTHLDILNKIFWDCVDAYPPQAVDMEELAAICYRCYNRYFNFSVYRLDQEASSVSIEDFIEVVEHPPIKAAIEAIDVANGSNSAIRAAYVVASKALVEDKALYYNAVASRMRSEAVNTEQVMQMLIGQGIPTDIDSQYFREAIPSSYLWGANSLYEILTGSRKMAKAECYKEKPIESSEYFNRKLQLMCDVLAKIDRIATKGGKTPQIVKGDCHTTRTLHWAVKAKDLKALAGKYYVDKASPTGYSIINAHDAALVGKTIEVRSILLCEEEANDCVCEVCYGQLAKSLPEGTNIGHMAAVCYGERVTQQMLGIKHVDHGKLDKPIALGAMEREWLEPVPKTRTLRFTKKAKKYRVTLSMKAEDVESIAELQFVKKVDELPVSRISEIEDFFLSTEDEQGERTTAAMTIGGTGEKAHFTHDFLRFVRNKTITLSDSGRYLFDMDGFPADKPIFTVPTRDVNILDYLNSIVRYITSADPNTGKDEEKGKTLASASSIEEALVSLLELTQVKMLVNVVHLEVMIKSTMGRDPKHLDFRFPFPGNAMNFLSLAKAVRGRSLSAAFAFEGQPALLLDPATYLNEKRPNHPMDPFLVPPKARR